MRQTFDAIRYALRQLRAVPVFTVAALLTLALGIGGTTAIVTLIQAVMLKSLPVADPEALFRIGDGSDCCVVGSLQDRWGLFSYPLFKRLRDQAPEFEQVTAFQSDVSRLSVRREGVDEASRPLNVEYVSGEYFQVFGVGAFGGRVLTPQDDVAGAPPAAVLSYHAWQSAYGGDTAVVGAILDIERHPFTIAGVAPPGFFGETLRGDPTDLWIPLATNPILEGDNGMLVSETSAWLRAIGRLKPNATTAGLPARLTSYLQNWIQHEAGYPANWMPDILRQLRNQHIDVVPAGAGVGLMKEQYKTSLQTLFVVCGVVLLIACANLANLLLARAVTRRTQTAVRLAMGASRATLVFQALVEAIVLALLGAAAGLVVAVGASRLLLTLAFANVQFLPISTWPSFGVLGFAAGLALVTGVIFGAAPAWFATRTDPIEALRGVGRVRDGSSVARKSLLVVQATLSVVLVTGATLLARTLNNLEHQDFGFDVKNRVVVSLAHPPSEYDWPKLSELYRRLDDRLMQVPGVTGAGLALYNPLTNNWGEGILVQGHPPPKAGTATGASWDRVSADYMHILGMRMVRGRAFTPRDNATAAPTAIVNEAFVKRFFSSDENPIGMHFGLDLPENAGTFEIVGIVRDAKFADLALDKPARPMFFVPLEQYVNYQDTSMQRLELNSHFIRAMALVTSQPVSVMEPAIRRAVAEVDPNLTIVAVRTLEDQVALSFNQQRAVAGLATLFGSVALLLAAIGLYSVTAYSVAQQTNEIGVRMALGADRSRVVTHVLRGAFTWVLVGLVIGLPLAVAAGRAISDQLYLIQFWDPVAMGFASATLAIAALVAALIPAMKAAGISPTSALRAN
jgi:predicted permease